MTNPRQIGDDDDPIVAEVRAARAAIYAEAGGTLDGLFAFLKAREAEHPERLGTPGPRTE